MQAEEERGGKGERNTVDGSSAVERRDHDEGGGDRDRSDDRSRNSDRDKARDRSRERDRRGRERSRDRDRPRSRERRDRSRDRERPRDRSRDRARDRSRDRGRVRSRSRDRIAVSYSSNESSARANPNQEPEKPKLHPGLDPNWRPASQIAAAAVAAANGVTGGSSIVNAALIQQIQMQLRAAATPAQIKQRQTARRLYCGNLPVGLPGVEGLLTEFFNQTMMAAGLNDSSLPGYPALSVWLSAQQTFGFVEFRSEHEATNGMNLNGVMFSGRQLRVSRPADYIDPATGLTTPIPGQPLPATLPTLPGQLSAASMAAAVAMNPLLAASMQMQAAQGVGMLPLGAGLAVQQTPTCAIMLTNMVTLSDLEDATVVQEIKEDTIEECKKFGSVVACIVPTPHPPSEPATAADEHVGKIFVAFTDAAAASAAKDKLHGRKFDGKSVVAKVGLLERERKRERERGSPASVSLPRWCDVSGLYEYNVDILCA